MSEKPAPPEGAAGSEPPDEDKPKKRRKRAKKSKRAAGAGAAGGPAAADRRAAELAEATDAVERELGLLRAALQQVVDRIAMRVGGRLSRVEDALGQLRGDGPTRRGRLADLQAMRAALDGLALKPAKGRRRDLRQIIEVAALLEELVDGWD